MIAIRIQGKHDLLFDSRQESKFTAVYDQGKCGILGAHGAKLTLLATKQHQNWGTVGGGGFTSIYPFPSTVLTTTSWEFVINVPEIPAA